MRSRCNLKRHPRYSQYGGRGIKVCHEWDDFKKFYEWAIANGYDETLTIDRRDNDKGYCPDNCRWVDYKAQNNNRAFNVPLTFNGQTKTIAEWARTTGIKDGTLRHRLYIMKWPLERALTEPTHRKHPK
jgi:hypothetical protein